MEEFFEDILNKFDMSGHDVDALPPLVLAYIGDAVYGVYVRTMLIADGGVNVHNLHMRSIEFVSAEAQAENLRDILPGLTSEEQDVVRRGRNSNPATVPKHAEINEYRYATGFEALIGYLFLKKRLKRLAEILDLSAKK
ncbi:MAG: ribonuclease III domain-containing protein [Eubacteriales bacterium]|nr:ribonuclease III domain-containing protein [Eubacteriales bacterium]